ncbi:uncharacterized protein DFL_008800 [Arthrobotrys flagrans]|uniref:Uncharacterized protein n=1 Tax=Arthrobotrys flagrans TaxID=97331 RepID=A0A436ZPY3_ARTFL|nr:hypothetical protein DFL_008800 [Arthrobotrys flagrans]
MKNAIDTMAVPVFETWLDGSCTFANKTGLFLAAIDILASRDLELELEQYPLVTISFTKTLYIPKGWLSE